MAIHGVGTLLLYIVQLLTVCVPGITGDVNSHDQLLARIQALEDQGRTQIGKIQVMEIRLQEQGERLLSQETTIQQYKERVQQLERTVAQLHTEPEGPPINTEGSQDEASDMPEAAGQWQPTRFVAVKEVSKQRRVLMGSEEPVAFHAVINGYKEVAHLGVNQNIVFPDIMLNLGGGYHNQHGVFIAPKPGVYLFSTSITSISGPHSEIWVHLEKNGVILANAYGYGYHGVNDQGSVTVVTQLAVGDEVWVRLGAPVDALLGARNDSFTGLLANPL